jgi:hypothetical protein
MKTLWRWAAAALLLAAPLGVGVAAGAGGGGGPGPGTAPQAAFSPSARTVPLVTERAVVSVPGYWTRERMAAAADGARAAEAAPDAGVAGMPWAGGGAVARTTGRVFFTLNGTAYACSGSAVASAGQDVVMTAAHCVSDGAGHWATHWTFVPGYDDGREPYGSYPARSFYVPAPWSADANENDDFAFVTVGPAQVNGAAQQLGAAVGGQQIEFGSRAATEAVFGYPSEPPYNGQSLDYCQGALQPDPFGFPDEGIGCTMTEGGSGGPWLSDFDPRTGLGVITGVTTFRYSGENLTLYSADLGTVAKALYDQASSGSASSG